MDAFSYIDDPQSGVMNMAIDDAMLDFAEKHRVVVLRLYEWSEPTLSLGYFQKYSDFELHMPNSNLQVVRRATGGGAIVHHHDLTYSLAVPQSCLSIGAAPAIYSAVHQALVAWFCELGIKAQQWQETYNLPTKEGGLGASQKPVFLCFHRRANGDVVVGHHKVLGSAQRRKKGALLQHGSLLIRKSYYAVNLFGLLDLHPNEGKILANCRLFVEEVRLRIERGIDALLGVSVQYSSHMKEVLRSPATSKIEQFSAVDWRCRV